MQNSGFIWAGNLGCLLPFLIIFNLFFGSLIFNSTRLWLGTEAILILIFIINIKVMAHKIKGQFRENNRPNRGKVVDIQGHVVKDEGKLTDQG